MCVSVSVFIHQCVHSTRAGVQGGLTQEANTVYISIMNQVRERNRVRERERRRNREG